MSEESQLQTPDHVERFIPSPRWGYEATLSLKLMQWVAKKFPQPQVNIEWLAKTFHECRLKMMDGVMPDIHHIIGFVKEELMESNLKYSVIGETGFRSMNLQGRGRVPAPRLLVQIIDITEIFQLNKPGQIYELKLSDGDSVVDAIATSQSKTCNIGFYQLALGFKLQLRRPRIRHGKIVLQAHTISLLGGKCRSVSEEKKFIRTKRYTGIC